MANTKCFGGTYTNVAVNGYGRIGLEWMLHFLNIIVHTGVQFSLTSEKVLTFRKSEANYNFAIGKEFHQALRTKCHSCLLPQGRDSWPECPGHKPPLTKATQRPLLHKLVLPQVLCSPTSPGCVLASRLRACHCLWCCSIAQGLCKERRVCVLHCKHFLVTDVTSFPSAYICITYN